MSFWDIVWFIVISFAFIAYLMVMFAIITDLFRDKATSGIVKAAWFVALIFLPFLTACIYLITKGGSMERQTRDRETMRSQQEAYIREVASTTSPADQVAQAKKMLDSGAITESEYLRLKEKALAWSGGDRGRLHHPDTPFEGDDARARKPRGFLGLLMVVHVVVVSGFMATRALHARLAPLPGPAVEPGVAGAVIPTGRLLEEYVQTGLDDLRIMLVQAARRSRD